MFDKTKTYWNHNGKYEEKVKVLDDLIDEALVYDGPWKAHMPKSYSGGPNYHLERLRKAKYAYYRWYNDGDGSSILTQAAKKLGHSSWCIDHEAVEDVINAKIEAAWGEQNS